MAMEMQLQSVSSPGRGGLGGYRLEGDSFLLPMACLPRFAGTPSADKAFLRSRWRPTDRQSQASGLADGACAFVLHAWWTHDWRVAGMKQVLPTGTQSPIQIVGNDHPCTTHGSRVGFPRQGHRCSLKAKRNAEAGGEHATQEHESGAWQLDDYA